MSSVFRTWKIWVQFSGLNFWDLEKIDEKNQKKFKVPKMSKIVPECPNVFRSNFFEKKFAQCSMEGRVFENFQKKIKTFSNFQTCQKIVSKMSKRVLNMLWGIVFESLFAQCSLQGISDFLDWKLWVQILEIKKYEFNFPDLKTWVQFSDTTLNSHLFALTPQSMHAIRFQIFWS